MRRIGWTPLVPLNAVLSPKSTWATTDTLSCCDPGSRS
jgi:hypothetical protein